MPGKQTLSQHQHYKRNASGVKETTKRRTLGHQWFKVKKVSSFKFLGVNITKEISWTLLTYIVAILPKET